MRLAPPLALASIFTVLACSSAAPITGSGGHAGAVSTSTGGAGNTGAHDAGPGGSLPDASAMGGAGGADIDAGADASPPPPVDTLVSNRDRLLATYLDYLVTSATAPQTNGLSGGNVSSVCDLWIKLDPSARAAFLTITARLQGSLLGADLSSMLSHVTKVYRIAGGQGATATDPGSCGGGEDNRLIMSMDITLHDALLAANQHQGAKQGNGRPDISDIPAGKAWRDAHDLGGPHAPFDVSDETEEGAPRGQTQYFASLVSPPATSPLGRVDLMSLVDPLALEMDQDYDCVHASNPLCSYITYGPLCLPMPSATGTDIYQSTYGDFDAGYQPTGCGP